MLSGYSKLTPDDLSLRWQDSASLFLYLRPCILLLAVDDNQSRHSQLVNIKTKRSIRSKSDLNHIHLSTQDQKSTQMKGQKDCKCQRQEMTIKKPCFLGTRQLHIWTQSSCGNIHKVCMSSSQKITSACKGKVGPSIVETLLVTYCFGDGGSISLSVWLLVVDYTVG